MKRLLMVALVAASVVACSSQKEPAENAVKGLEAAAAEARPDIERYAADQLAGVDAAVKAVRSQFDNDNYAGAMSEVQQATATVTAAAQAAAARKAQLSTEWAAFAGMPAVIGQIKSKLAEFDRMRRLPRGMDKNKLDSAKSSLDSVTTMWDEASNAHDKGDLVVAVSKATDAKPVVDSLMTTLGIPMSSM